MSILEDNKNSIVSEIQAHIESGVFDRIPDVVEYLSKNKELEDILLHQYVKWIAPNLEEIATTQALAMLNVPKETALLQATLNDTVVIGDNHKMYTNCADALLEVTDNYVVKPHLVLKSNQKGLCRGYEITKSKSTNMEDGVGYVRTKNKFNKGCYWIYPIMRIYIEFILKYAQQYAIKCIYEDFETIFAFNDIIKERFGVDTKEWDTLHEPLDSFDLLFSFKQIMDVKDNGYISVANKTGTQTKLNLLTAYQIIPCYFEDALEYYGNGPATLAESLIFLSKYRHKNEGNWCKYYKNVSQIYKRDLSYHLTKDSLFAKYKYAEPIIWSQTALSLEQGLVAFKFDNNIIELYRLPKKNEALKERLDAIFLVKTKSQEYKEALASDISGGFDLELMMPFLRTDTLEVRSVTDEKAETQLISQYVVRGCFLVC